MAELLVQAVLDNLRIFFFFLNKIKWNRVTNVNSYRHLNFRLVHQVHTKKSPLYGIVHGTQWKVVSKIRYQTIHFLKTPVLKYETATLRSKGSSSPSADFQKEARVESGQPRQLYIQYVRVITYKSGFRGSSPDISQTAYLRRSRLAPQLVFNRRDERKKRNHVIQCVSWILLLRMALEERECLQRHS